MKIIPEKVVIFLLGVALGLAVCILTYPEPQVTTITETLCVTDISQCQ